MKPLTANPCLNYSILPRHGACLVCRKRKEKCTGNRPECCECVAGNRTCQYEDDAYRTRIQVLQDKVKELEARICAVEEKQSAHLSIPGPRSSSNGSEIIFRGLSSGSYSTPSNDQSYSSVPSSYDITLLGQASSSSTLSSAGIEPGSERLNLSWPPSDVIKRLLEIFQQRHAQCGFELHMGRVMQSLQPGAPEPIIPALFNAMLLIACYFAQDDALKACEKAFLGRTKLEIEKNIALAHGDGEGRYNPLYHLQAMIMLGTYYYFKGRLLEGHVHISHATRFAVGLGLHQLNTRIFHPDERLNEIKGTFSTERWHPRDSIELGEAINLWWSCFAWDMDGSTLNGLPISVSFDDITTVWPRPLSDFEPGNVLPDDSYSIASLLDPELSYVVADTSGDSLKALLAKANTLMHLAVELELERMSDLRGTEMWWAKFEQCDRSVNRFMQTMPPVDLARNIMELVSLVGIHTYMYCGQVQLHCALAEYEYLLGSHGDPRCIQPDGTLGGISYARCVEACRAASLAATLVADIDMSYLHMFIGIGWICVSEVIVRDVPRLRQGGQIVRANEREKQWQVVEKCMEQLVATYPVLSLQVEQLREMKRDQILRLSGKV